MKNKLKLILPNRKYVNAYLKAQKDFETEKSQATTSMINEKHERALHSSKDFPEYNKRLIKNRKGIDLKKGRVPNTFFWAIVGSKVVGFLDIRHYLNKNLSTIGGHIGYAVVPSERRKGCATEMLRLGLKQAWKLGNKKALITCDEDNIGSRKVIEKNGGIFAGKHKNKEGIKLRYWIYKNER